MVMRRTRKIEEEISSGVWHLPDTELEIIVYDATAIEKSGDGVTRVEWKPTANTAWLPDWAVLEVYLFGRHLWQRRHKDMPKYVFLSVHKALTNSCYLWYRLPNGEEGEIRNSWHYRQIDAETWRRFWRRLAKKGERKGSGTHA